MNVRSFGAMVLVPELLSAACALATPPAARAAGVERMQCEPENTAQQEQLIRSATVLKVEALRSHVASSPNNSEERVIGAKLLVRPPQGMTAEQMTRVLQCHTARILLGKVDVQEAQDDPYWLPDTWTNIDVTPENGNFAITVSADTVENNLEVLSRVNRYAKQRMLAAEPALP